MGTGIVRVGPAGWSYKDWEGIVYPPDMPKSLHPLEFLCRFFDTVEVNSTFYRPPNPRHCESWVRKAEGNPRFKFTVKLWERFTHKRDAPPSEEDVRVFCDGIAPLVDAGKLGAILIQFPWSFKRTTPNRRWLADVVARFSEYPLALEVRHDSWDRPEVFQGLKERNVALCSIDQPMFSGSLKPTDDVTATIGYVRLHGRNKADWFRKDAGRDDRYNYLYELDELASWLKRIERIREQADEIYAITNNHYRGQAVVNAFELEDGLGKTFDDIPESLTQAYPRLERLTSADGETS